MIITLTLVLTGTFVFVAVDSGKNTEIKKKNMIPKESVKAGLIGGIGGLIVSTLINYFILPVPETAVANALGNGISGLMSGFMGGFLAIKNINNKKK